MVKKSNYSISTYNAPITNTKPNNPINLGEVHTLIAGNRLKENTNKLRNLDTEKASKFKKQSFPYATFSGVFEKRADDKILKYSGLICIDIDHVRDPNLLKKQLINDPYITTRLLFISLSGKGIKWIVNVGQGSSEHRNTFSAIKNYLNKSYGLNGDGKGEVDSTPDISRACFLCHDPNSYLNLNESDKKFEINSWLTSEPRIEKKNVIKKEISKTPIIAHPIDSSGETYKGIEDLIFQLELLELDITEEYEDWIKYGFVLVNELGENGSNLFQRLSRFNKEYDRSKVAEKYANFLEKAGSTPHPATIKSLISGVQSAVNERLKESEHINTKGESYEVKLNEGDFLDQAYDSNGEILYPKGSSLPSGIFNKNYPGVGATYTQLHSNDDTIIVLPYTLLAKEKASKSDEYFYLKTLDNQHRCNFQELEAYMRSDIKVKKIILVVDNLEKLLKSLCKLQYNPISQFHLLVDEVNTIQVESSFRKGVLQAYPYFKLFKKKTFLTATNIGFSDPEIKNLDTYNLEVIGSSEEESEIGYKPFTIEFSFANNPIDYVALELSTFLDSTTDNFEQNRLDNPGNKEDYLLDVKFVIAINNASLIRVFIDKVLEFSETISKDDIAVFTSDNSSYENLKEYTDKGIITKGILPTRLNVGTSILFKGIDIEEDVCPILISTDSKSFSLISDSDIIQFMGRCRENAIEPKFYLPKEINITPYIDVSEVENNIKQYEKAIISLNQLSENEIKKYYPKKAKDESVKNYLLRNPFGGLDINYLLLDQVKYQSQIIPSYLEPNDLENGIITKLRRHYAVTESSIRVDAEQQIEETVNEAEVDFTESIEALMSYIKSGLSEEESIQKLKSIDKNKESQRGLIYLNLFGIKCFGTMEDGYVLCKLFLELYPKKINFLYIAKLQIDILILYIHQPEKFNKIVQSLIDTKSGNGNVLKDEIDNAINSYREYLPSIAQRKSYHRAFMKLAFNIDPTGNKLKYSLKNKILKPLLISRFSGLEKTLKSTTDRTQRIPLKSDKKSVSRDEVLYLDF